MRVNWYALIIDCIERGLEAGWHRAHKHNDNPEPAVIRDAQLDAIMMELNDYIDFSESTTAGPSGSSAE